MTSAHRLAILGCLALLLIAMRAAAADPGHLAAVRVPAALAPEVLSRRERLLDRGRACRERHPQTARYIRSILGRLVRSSRLDDFAQSMPKLAFVLDCSIPLPIAMATVGKIMAVPRALPAHAASEDAIAAVLGHELAHLRLQHLEQRLGATSGPLALVPSARQALERAQEQEADLVGLDLATSAGYDPYAAIDHMRRTEELALALQRSGRLRAQSNDPVYGKLETRLARIYARIRARGYRPKAARTPVASLVKVELGGP
jgi:predicted Zn-dependent protease